MDILEKIRAMLRSRLGDADRAFLYGSRARGNARSDSDWDILIILDKEKICSEDYDTFYYPLTSLGWDIDQIISPVLYSRREWEQQSPTPFYKNVVNDAIPLI